MLSSIAAELASELSNRSEFAAFFDLLGAFQSNEGALKKLIRSPEQRANVTQQLTAAAKSARPWSVQAAASSYRSRLAFLFESQVALEDVSDLSADVEAFLENFENYLLHQSEDRLFHLAWHAIALSHRLNGFLTALRFMVDALGTPDVADDNVLVIRLVGQTDLQHLKQSISAVQKMYDEIARLIHVSIDDEPLELLKLETGSLEIILRGSKAVIQILGKFLAGFAAYASMSKRFADTNVLAESLHAQLRLRDSLAAQGVDVANLDEHIAGATIVLAKLTHKLVENAESVGVNGTLVDLAGDLAKLVPPERKLLSPPEEK